jgi:hypothetical protein
MQLVACVPRVSTGKVWSFRDGASAPGPESITTNLSVSRGRCFILLSGGYGFRAPRSARPRNDAGKPTLRRPVEEGAGAPSSISAPLKKMRGAERRQALVRIAAPVVRLAVGPISGSPEMTGGIRPPARLSALCCGVLTTASGRAFRDGWAPSGPRPSGLSGQNVRRHPQRRTRLRQPAPGRGISPPGGAPTPPVCRLRAEPPGRRTDRRPGFPGRPTAGLRACSPAPLPACSAITTPHESAPR